MYALIVTQESSGDKKLLQNEGQFEMRDLGGMDDVGGRLVDAMAREA